MFVAHIIYAIPSANFRHILYEPIPSPITNFLFISRQIVRSTGFAGPVPEVHSPELNCSETILDGVSVNPVVIVP